MQKIKNLIILTCVVFSTVNLYAQEDSTGLPGDNFSLQGALELFKQSSSPEEFEKLLNSQDKNVNNLDLNGDGETDYIRVINKKDGDAQVFILQVPVSENESQDIAVIELEKTGDTTAIIQITGDEDIYGEQKIVEPSDEGDEVFNFSDADANTSGPSILNNSAVRIVVNVFYWPCVRFVYRPAYVPWVSPFRWRHYPVWWRPWHPVAWRIFHPGCYRYHTHFAVVRTHRAVVAHRIYKPYRTSSPIVVKRTTVARKNYRVTRTRVTGPAGNTRVKTTVHKRGKGRRG
ncbi:MAG: hypothetical protein R2765_05390 [Ferruginibacter sp.]|nr:hypothetical protein [Bacteroidota bacterium]MBX2917621.1 hypothetical protein [Ferruginibacter sp.]MCC7377933.1 hypothetical protein [Chitinophagaceae bacterium]